jgi:periplasmic protein TonB
MIHIVDGRYVSPLPGRRYTAGATSLAIHALAVSIILLAATSMHQRATAAKAQVATTQTPLEHLVFIVRESPGPAAGGGGGGNRQPEPIRRAEAPGTDRITLRIARPMSVQGREDVVSSLPALVLDATPLSSGTVDQLGLPTGGVSIGTSLGPGSGGGVGDGVGTGIGPGRGPGLGDGSGGGTGGGPFRAGGSVTPPRVIIEVKPTYTNRAMIDRIEGSVMLEVIVRANGIPTNIRVTRSLDPDGLDGEAVRAASQWRFEPGRLNGTPVDVVASIQIDFHIR